MFQQAPSRKTRSRSRKAPWRGRGPSWQRVARSSPPSEKTRTAPLGSPVLGQRQKVSRKAPSPPGLGPEGLWGLLWQRARAQPPQRPVPDIPEGPEPGLRLHPDGGIGEVPAEVPLHLVQQHQPGPAPKLFRPGSLGQIVCQTGLPGRGGGSGAVPIPPQGAAQHALQQPQANLRAALPEHSGQRPLRLGGQAQLLRPGPAPPRTAGKALIAGGDVAGHPPPAAVEGQLHIVAVKVLGGEDGDRKGPGEPPGLPLNGPPRQGGPGDGDPAPRQGADRTAGAQRRRGVRVPAGDPQMVKLAAHGRIASLSSHGRGRRPRRSGPEGPPIRVTFSDRHPRRSSGP